MVSVEENLFTRLTGDSAVSALVGDRVFPVNEVPTNLILPAITYQRISTKPVSQLVGTNQLEVARIQVSSWADTYGGTKSIASAVKAALDGNQKTTFQNEVDRHDKDTDLSFIVQDFVIWND